MRSPLVLLLVLAACASPAPAPPAPARATLWLDAMESGEWSSWRLPEVTWDDVPALLAEADSHARLAGWPANPLSSYLQSSGLRGTVALWMIESLRADRPNGFPSLNALLFGGRPEGDWEEASDANLDVAARAYRAWWERVRHLPVPARRAEDPLAGSGVRWY